MVVQSPSYPHQKHGAISVLFTPKAGVNKHFLFEKHGIQGYQITFTFTFIYFLHILQGSSNFCRMQHVLYFLRKCLFTPAFGVNSTEIAPCFWCG